MNLLVSTNLSEEAEASDVVDPPPGTRTVLLDHVPARLSGVGTACHSEGGLQVTSVEGLGLGMGVGVEPAPGATRCAPVALVHALLLGLALVPHPTLLIRGTAVAELVQNLSAAEGGVTVEMTSEIAGPDLQYKSNSIYSGIFAAVIMKVTIPVLQYHNEVLIRALILIAVHGIVIGKERSTMHDVNSSFETEGCHLRILIITPDGI